MTVGADVWSESRISNGSWKIIKRYRELFKCAYPIYVDEDRHLYEKMGMVSAERILAVETYSLNVRFFTQVRLTNDFGPLFNGRAAYNQRSAPAQLVHGLKVRKLHLPRLRVMMLKGWILKTESLC
jgi:hypothetical protein